MVHRKTEYRLQYNFLPEDIRKKIWTDNANLRSGRKLWNQADHYWEYQVNDDNCVCDGEEAEDDSGPPPPHKLKHKALLARYGQRSRSCSNGLDQQSPVLDRCHEIAVQTPNWKTKLEKPKKDIASETDSGRASSEEIQNVMKNMSTLTLPEVSTEGRISGNRPQTPIPPHSSHTSLQRQSRPSSALRQRSRTPVPSKTSKKLMVEGKKTHFVPYGWNERETDVGQKKTFNVLAPKKEVHHHAVEVSCRKKAEIEKYIREDMARQKYRLRTPYPMGNASSIWMSEYKEQFCRSRPSSAPPPPLNS